MPLLDVFGAIVIIALFFAWLMLLFRVFADLLRSRDLGGWAKALWALAVIVMPLVGVLVYVGLRGKGMRERSVEDALRVGTRGGSMPGDMRRAGSQAYINTQGL
jgi:ABC-type Fe3+ transport system permease subunit